MPAAAAATAAAGKPASQHQQPQPQQPQQPQPQFRSTELVRTGGSSGTAAAGEQTPSAPFRGYDALQVRQEVVPETPGFYVTLASLRAHTPSTREEVRLVLARLREQYDPFTLRYPCLYLVGNWVDTQGRTGVSSGA